MQFKLQARHDSAVQTLPMLWFYTFWTFLRILDLGRLARNKVRRPFPEAFKSSET
jgi:hypothetical protein